MNKFKISAYVLSLFMVACSSDDEIVNNQEKSIDVIPAEIIQLGDANGTRVIIDGNPGDANRPMTWRADDPRTKVKNEADGIYVFDTKGNSARFEYCENIAKSKGVFKRIKGNIVDIKDAISVPYCTQVANPTELPANSGADFKYMNTTIYHQGAENAPMYGKFENGVLKFRPVTGILEIEVKNFTEIQKKIDEIVKNDPKGKAKQNMAIKLTAYDKDGNVVKTSANTAKLNETKDGLTFTAASGLDYVNLMVNDVNLFNEPTDNRFYFPMITGEYSKFEISIHYPNVKMDDSHVFTETVTVTPKSGTLKIDKKIYSISKSFTLLPEK